MSITEARQETFDFSEPYFTSGIQLGVLEASDIQSLDDLDGKAVAVKTGTQGQTFADENKDEYGFTVTPYQDTTDMVDAVKAGQAVGYFEDFPVLAYGIQQGSGFRLIGKPELGGEYGFAVNKGENPELIEMFNAGLANLQSSGEYDEIVDTYLSGGEESAQPTDIISVAVEYWPALMQGLWLTILATLVAVVAAFILGIIFGFGRLAKFAPLRWVSTAYVYVFRGTPILIQAFFVFFAIPQLIPDLKFDPFVAGAITLSLNTGAYMTEIIRGGIQAVDPAGVPHHDPVVREPGHHHPQGHVADQRHRPRGADVRVPPDHRVDVPVSAGADDRRHHLLHLDHAADVACEPPGEDVQRMSKIVVQD
ncbi:ABC transporter substrate-binding protein/permease, partial [Nocardia salmonicida]